MLWDTAGQEEFDAITKAYYRGAQACVLAFSTVDRDSFEAAHAWKLKVSKYIYFHLTYSYRLRSSDLTYGEKLLFEVRFWRKKITFNLHKNMSINSAKNHKSINKVCLYKNMSN